MTTHRAPSWTRIFVVVVCLLAWLEMSNHCALAALQHRKVESCCHRAEKKDASKDSMVCCQKLQTTEQVKLTVPALPVLSLAEGFLTLFSIALPVADDEFISSLHAGASPPAVLVSRLDAQRGHPAFAPPSLS
jgi:hypothetical protein